MYWPRRGRDKIRQRNEIFIEKIIVADNSALEYENKWTTNQQIHKNYLFFNL